MPTSSIWMTSRRPSTSPVSVCARLLATGLINRLRPDRQAGQAGGLRLAGDQVRVLQRLSRRALAQIVDRADCNDETGARIHRIRQERQIRSGDPSRLRAPSLFRHSDLDEGLAAITRLRGLGELLDA